MKSVFINSFVDERISENRDLFTSKEMDCIEKNKECFYKVYLLGAINATGVYMNDEDTR